MENKEKYKDVKKETQEFSKVIKNIKKDTDIDDYNLGFIVGLLHQHKKKKE